MIINFLEADVPLTKTFRQTKGGAIEKDAYPLVARVTSHEEQITTPTELYKAIMFHADLGHCLLKGTLSRPLVNESRRGTTHTDDQSEWVCLDFDRHEAPDIDETLTTLGLGDVTYVLQYSASQGLDEHDGTISAHVFMLLDKAMPAPALKGWLMNLNFKHMSDGLRLSRSKVVISYPLDITTCQNDKLLYITPPRFIKPLKDPLQTRISMVPKKLSTLPHTRIGGTHISALKAEERKQLNELRKAEGLPTRTAKTTIIGNVEVQNKPDECRVSEVKDCGEFVRLNLNDGDSWAYWYAKKNFELVHDFKSDTWYKMKELIPGHYQRLIEERKIKAATPNEEGDLILAFSDKKTGVYYRGTWNPTTQLLELYKAKDKSQLGDWYMSFGLTPPEFTETWDITFDPHGDWVVDEEKHQINTFRPSPYFSVEPNEKAVYPVIEKVICHLLGVKNSKDELYQHFLNWLAVLFQRKAKPLTAWVVHGQEGTGKGTLFGRILQPLLGGTNVFAARIDNLEENFNGWLQGKLLILVDEVDVDDFREKGRVSSKLRNYITEPMVSFRHMQQAAVFDNNYASFIFASNRKQPVYIPSSDRRYNCGNYQAKRLIYPGDEALANELENFAAFLLAHKADTEQANKVMQTEARERIQKLGITSIEETCSIIKNGDFDALWLSMPDEKLMAETGIKNTHTDNAQAYCMLMRKLRDEALTSPKSSLSRDEMLIILQYNVGNMPQTPNKFTSLLRHNGIETSQLRRNGMKTMGMPIEWKISDELRAEFSTKPALRRAK